MKILQIAGSGTVGIERMGPVSRDICNLSNCFQNLGHDVTVVDAETTIPRVNLDSRVRVLETSTVSRTQLGKKLINNKLRYLLSWKTEFQFVKALQRLTSLENFDIIHAHEHVPALILSYLCRDRLVYTSHTPTWLKSETFKQKREIRFEKFERLLRIHEADVICRCSLTIALGDYLQTALPQAPIVVIPNGIDLESWVPVERMEARRQLGIAQQDFVLLSVTRFDPVKGIETLINAVKELTNKVKYLNVSIIGPLDRFYGSESSVSSYARSIMSKTEGLPISFKGFIHNGSPEFRCWLSAADLFVHTALFEPQGNVILEALSMGLPVVASRAGGTPQMVGEKVGLLFEAGDWTDLSQKVLFLYNNRERLKSMQLNCRKQVEEHFSWKGSAEKHLWAFEKIRRKYPLV